jgi:hypothetical protein
MAKRRKAKAVKDQERLNRRMVKLLAWHGLTLEQAGQLPDAELRRHKYIGPQILEAIRAAAGGPPPTSVEPTPHSREGEAQPQVVTAEQVEAILNVLNMLIDHADRVASKAQVGVVAARDLLVSKGIVTEEEWDAAVDRVERGQATLFALDPDVQRAVDEIRRLLDPEEPNGGSPEEGGEA